MLDREACRLRPITEVDLEKILVWRNSERIRMNMYTDHIITMEEHKAWFERQKQSKSSVYLIFALNGEPAGLVYFTDIDRKNGRSFWGFYLGEEDLPRGSGTALGWLGLDYAFDRLATRKLCGEVFAFNTSSINFHQKLGFVQEGRFLKHVLKNGGFEDVISFALFREDWEKVREKLAEIAFSQGNTPS